MSQKPVFVPKTFVFRMEQFGDLFTGVNKFIYAAQKELLITEAKKLQRKSRCSFKEPKPVIVAFDFQQRLLKLREVLSTDGKHPLDFAK